MNKEELEDYLLGFLTLTIIAQCFFGFLMFKMFEVSLDPYSDVWNLLLTIFLFLNGEAILLFCFYNEIKALKIL